MSNSTPTGSMHHDDKTLTSLDEGSGSGPAGAPAEGALDVLGAAGADAGAGATGRRRRMSRSSMLIVVTVACSGAAIAGMRHLAGGPRSSLAAPVKIDYDVDKSRVGAGDHKKVLAELATTHAAQVPPEQVQRNPFMMAGALEEMQVGGPTTGDLEAAKSEKAARAEAEKVKREREEHQRAVETAFNELDLHSVMGGPTPVARISGQTVRIGDTIGNYFKVTAIQGRTVTLEADGKMFTLTMSTGPAPAPAKPAGGGPGRPR
jgi:hypothetical protein